jgi:hypothetical protein
MTVVGRGELGSCYVTVIHLVRSPLAGIHSLRLASQHAEALQVGRREAVVRVRIERKWISLGTVAPPVLELEASELTRDQLEAGVAGVERAELVRALDLHGLGDVNGEDEFVTELVEQSQERIARLFRGRADGRRVHYTYLTSIYIDMLMGYACKS